MPSPRRKSWLIRTTCLIGLVLLFWWWPAFHIVNLGAAQQVAKAFDAEAFVNKFWSNRLLQSLDRSIDAPTLVAEIGKDPKSAHEKYGHGTALSSVYYYFIAGEGHVVAVNQSGVLISLNPNSSNGDVLFETGKIFGNAVRDGTGLLNVSDFADSQDFNAVSAVINRRIEDTVLPGLCAKAIVGSTVRFAGCAAVVDEDTDLHPLSIVPLYAVMQ